MFCFERPRPFCKIGQAKLYCNILRINDIKHIIGVSFYSIWGGKFRDIIKTEDCPLFIVVEIQGWS